MLTGEIISILITLSLWCFFSGVDGQTDWRCSGRTQTLTTLEGEFDDGYDRIPETLTCSWVISPVNNTLPIQLAIHEFEIDEYSPDSLRIYDGPKADSKNLLKTLRETNRYENPVSITWSTKGSMYVLLTVNSGSAGRYSSYAGFRATYSIFKKKPECKVNGADCNDLDKVCNEGVCILKSTTLSTNLSNSLGGLEPFILLFLGKSLANKNTYTPIHYPLV